MTNNFSNLSTEFVKETQLGYSLFITLFFLTPVFVFNIILAVFIIVEKTLPGTVRLILTNILATSELVILGIAMILTKSVILTNLDYLSPSDFACRLSYVTLGSGAAARLLFMATFSVTVYILVCRGANKLRFLPMSVAVGAIWAFATIPNLVVFFPEFLEITFHDGADCAAHGRGATTILYSVTYITAYGLCSFVPSIVFPILTLRFIKRNTITGNKQVLQGMVKFAVFLLIGNSLNLVGISTPLLFGTFAPSGEDYYTLEKAFNYAEGIFLMLSLIPTPIILLVFFKPLRRGLRSMFCFLCTRNGIEKQQHSSSGKTPSTGMDSV